MCSYTSIYDPVSSCMDLDAPAGLPAQILALGGHTFLNTFLFSLALLSSSLLLFSQLMHLIGTSGRRSSRSPSRRLTSMTIVDRYFHYSFRILLLLFFFSVIQGVLGLKKYLAKVDGSTQKPWSTPLSRPRLPFWIFADLIEGMIESKNLFRESWSEGPIT